MVRCLRNQRIDIAVTVSRTLSFVVGLALAGMAAFAALGQDSDPERTRICQPGFSATIRPSVMATEAIKRTMLSAQGIPMSDIGKYELDHIVPLCLDGAPLDLSNLQLQLWPAAHTKDLQEAAACRAYCHGEMTLEQAQGMFHRDVITWRPPPVNQVQAGGSNGQVMGGGGSEEIPTGKTEYHHVGEITTQVDGSPLQLDSTSGHCANCTYEPQLRDFAARLYRVETLLREMCAKTALFEIGCGELRQQQ